jgi:hypothetical protein
LTTIEFVDQALRDGQQSLWGMQRAYQAADALSHLARTGFRTVNLTGAGKFTVLLRHLRDDPEASTDFLVEGLRHAAGDGARCLDPSAAQPREDPQAFPPRTERRGPPPALHDLQRGGRRHEGGWSDPY